MTASPEWLVPMAATLTQERFTGPEWIFERKLDGIRLLAFKRGRDVRLFSRNRLPQNHCYPSVVQAIAELPPRDLILDGEAAWDTHSKVLYHVFDVMWIDGRDVRSLPLEERRKLLKDLPLRAPLGRVPEVKDTEPWERASREGWEGVIAKRRDSLYEHRRSPHWLKMKCEASQELVVGGFTEPQGGRVGLGALLVGYFEGEDFVYAGKLGTGFDTKMLLDLRARLDKIEIDTPPFTKAIGLPKKRSHWVKPQIVVQVAFIEWTVHGNCATRGSSAFASTNRRAKSLGSRSNQWELCPCARGSGGSGGSEGSGVPLVPGFWFWFRGSGFWFEVLGSGSGFWSAVPRF